MARNALLGMAQMPTLQYRPETQVESLGKATQAVGGLQAIQMRQMDLEKAKQDSAMLQQFSQRMAQAGKNPDPSIYGQALIQTGRPELVAKGTEIMRAVQSEAALKQELGGYQNRLAQGDARGVAQSMAVSPTPGMAQRAQALTRTLPPEARPARPQDRYINVGGALFDTEIKDWLQPRSVRGEATQSAGVKPPSGYRFTPDGSLEPIPGGPAAARGTAVGTPAQQATAARREKAQSNLSQDLKTQLGYYEKLNKIDGMTSPTRSTVENIAAYARSSGPGQEAERAIATQAQTLRDNIKNTRQRLLMHIKDATGATSSQMNSNMEMQAWLNSMTDPQQSIETVRETLKQMDSVIAGMREQVAREAAAKGGAGAAPAAAPSRSTGVDIQTERANAQAAIAAGAPEAAVRQRFKDKTGQEL